MNSKNRETFIRLAEQLNIGLHNNCSDGGSE
jgi:hypothetical protein